MILGIILNTMSKIMTKVNIYGHFHPKTSILTSIMTTVLDESLINDDPSDLFSDFNLEEVQGALGIAPVVQDTIEDKSSTKSENYSEKDYSSNEKSRTNTGSVSVTTSEVDKDEIEHHPVTPKEKENNHEETSTDR